MLNHRVFYEEISFGVQKSEKFTFILGLKVHRYIGRDVLEIFCSNSFPNCKNQKFILKMFNHVYYRAHVKWKHSLPYFFGYKTVFFSFQNNPKDLDPSYKTDLDLWDCLGRVKLVL